MFSRLYKTASSTYQVYVKPNAASESFIKRVALAKNKPPVPGALDLTALSLKKIQVNREKTVESASVENNSKYTVLAISGLQCRQQFVAQRRELLLRLLDEEENIYNYAFSRLNSREHRSFLWVYLQLRNV